MVDDGVLKGAYVTAVQSRLTIVPVTLAEAKAFVGQVHRHHGPPVGHRVSVGVVDEDDRLRGVAVMGRPVARALPWRRVVIEITRVATDGCPNACSALYGAACRMQKVHGYQYTQTYTLLSEPGTSLRAAGYKPVRVTGRDDWDTPARRRDSGKHPDEPKVCWECRCGPHPAIDLEAYR